MADPSAAGPHGSRRLVRRLRPPAGLVAHQLRRHRQIPGHSRASLGFLIADETHKLKNPRAKRTQLVFGGDEHRAITVHKALLLTGTPMVNHVHDLFTQLHYIDPDTWPSLDRFIHDHYNPGYLRVSADQVIGTPRNLPLLRHQLRMVMMRHPSRCCSCRRRRVSGPGPHRQ